LLLQAAAILNPQRIPFAELSQHLQEGLGWSDADVGRALDTCLDLHLLSGTPDPSMHQLFGKFLRATTVSSDDRVSLESVRAAQRKRFVELAASVSENPADSLNAAALISYRLTLEAWEEVAQLPSVAEGETIGRGLHAIGRSQEARPWFERAVAGKEKGGVDGRVDHASLSKSLHSVGLCLSNVGQYAEARSWFERAVAESEKGDVHGRIDHESLGKSLHMVGWCLSSTGQHGEALPWYERAVAEKEKGDVHGRIDHASLSITLRDGAGCLRKLGKNEQAHEWEQRASRKDQLAGGV
jgi:tetratricopeptide (TPR) repeat protein